MDPADPGPLGLAAFAGTTFVLSIFSANLVNPAGTAVVLPLTLAFGGIAQLLAGMWEFRTGNTFGALAFSAYGAFWISLYLLLTVVPASAATESAVAVYLYSWAIFTTYMFVASLRTTGAIAGTFFLLTITFFLLAIADAGSDKSILHIGGWFGLATAIAAWYASFAGVLNATWGRVVLPVMPLSRPTVR